MRNSLRKILKHFRKLNPKYEFKAFKLSDNETLNKSRAVLNSLEGWQQCERYKEIEVFPDNDVVNNKQFGLVITTTKGKYRLVYREKSALRFVARVAVVAYFAWAAWVVLEFVLAMK